MKNVEILTGNCLDILKNIEDEKVQCCVTSPPYYGLRNYNTDLIIWDGNDNCKHEWELSINPQTKVGRNGYTDPKHQTLVDVMDIPTVGSFCTKCGAWKGSLGMEPSPELYIQHLTQIFHEVKRVLKKEGVLWLNIGDSYAGSGKAGNNPEYWKKHKEFGKPSVHKERFGLSGVVPKGLKPKDLMGIPWLLAFALRDDGWYLRCDIIWNKGNCMPSPVKDRPTRSHEYIFLMSKSRKYYYDYEDILEPYTKELNRWGGPKLKADGCSTWDEGTGQSTYRNRDIRPNKEGKNKRSVWNVNTKIFKGAHFAIFPQDLIKPCILAGSREGDIILDPFGGSGTTAVVSSKLNRKSILIELKEDYVNMSKKRLQDENILNKENINIFFE